VEEKSRDNSKKELPGYAGGREVSPLDCKREEKAIEYSPVLLERRWVETSDTEKDP